MAQALARERFVTQEVCEQHWPRFVQYFKAQEWKRASILKVLMWDENCIPEHKYVDYHIEELNQGYAPLPHLTIDLQALPEFSLRECWATLTLPFDVMGGMFFVATACHASKTVREHWERRLTRNIIWYITDLSALSLTLERLEMPTVIADEADETKAEASMPAP